MVSRGITQRGCSAGLDNAAEMPNCSVPTGEQRWFILGRGASSDAVRETTAWTMAKIAHSPEERGDGSSDEDTKREVLQTRSREWRKVPIGDRARVDGVKVLLSSCLA